MNSKPFSCRLARGTTRAARGGFTLVELLVVIAIIGILVAALLPAVNMAREAARKTQCGNNVNQMAKAVFLFETNHRVLPSGGWGWRWTGDPDVAPGRSQPGGWIYQILPYLELSNLHDLGKGLSGQPRQDATREMLMTSQDLFSCPSRRRAEPLPFVAQPFINTPEITACNRTDYGANAGDAAGTVDSGSVAIAYDKGPAAYSTNQEDLTFNQAVHNGVIYQTSAVRTQAISDGLSKTYLIAERYLTRDHYYDGLSKQDNRCLFVGWDDDNIIVTRVPWTPMRDASGAGSDVSWRFGSAHSSSLQAAFCDGSVKSIAYTIDQEVHRRLGNRKDGLPISSNAY